MEHNRVVYTRPYNAEVEYLEVDNTLGCYIDTGILPSDKVSIVAQIQVLSNYYGFLFEGGANGNQAELGFLLNDGNNNAVFRYGNKNVLKSLSSLSLPSEPFIVSSLDNPRTFVVNNTNFTVQQNTFLSQNSIYLFGFHRNALSGSSTRNCRVYYFKMYDSGTLVRDFIPVRIGQIGYMYDRVSGKLFGNKGTGNFTLGPDVANQIPNIRRVFRFGNKRFVMPMPYDSKIEYLESTGIQYIDTGIYGSNNSKIEVDLQLLELDASKAVFGCHSSNNSNLYLYQSGGNNFGKWQFGFGWNANCGKTDTNRHLVVCENFDLTIDGSLIFSHIPRNFATPQTLLMFNMYNNAGEIYSSTRMRVFSCKLYNSNILVRDLIPVRRGNVGYMYDKVSGKLFGNSGTGQFILGNDIND